MGHGNSRAGSGSSSDDSADASKSPSTRAERIKKRLHLHRPHFHRRRHRATDSPSGSHTRNLRKLLKEEDFAGIALLRLITVSILYLYYFLWDKNYYHYCCYYYFVLQAEMKFKDKWLACVTLGEQTFRTHVTDQFSKVLCFISDSDASQSRPKLYTLVLFIVISLRS